MTASVFDYRDINTRLRTIGRDASDRGGGDCDDAGDRATSQGRLSRERLDRTAFRVYFACGETSIGRQREAVENAAREILRVSSGSPSSSIELHGYTDSRGSHARNMRLGAERALAVKRVLVSCGIDSRRMDLFSHGPDRSLADGAADGSSNRRVEIVVTGATMK